MRVNFSDIPDEGLLLELRESPRSLHLGISEIKVYDPVEFKGRLDRVEKDVLVRGDLKTTVEVACARCLKPFLLPVSVRVEVEYHPKAREPQEEEVELKEEEIDVYLYARNRLDLGDAFRDQILLAMPMKPLCAGDCKGLCPRCGANLNQRLCACREEGADPRLQILRTLKKEHGE